MLSSAIPDVLLYPPNEDDEPIRTSICGFTPKIPFWQSALPQTPSSKPVLATVVEPTAEARVLALQTALDKARERISVLENENMSLHEETAYWRSFYPQSVLSPFTLFGVVSPGPEALVGATGRWPFSPPPTQGEDSQPPTPTF